MSLEKFADKMIEHGIGNIPDILPDGIIHRFPTWGDRSGGLSGAYWHNGRCGWFQDWRSMARPVEVNGKASQEDLKALKDSLSGNANKVSREEMIKEAREIWDNAPEVISHDYITKKQIQPPPGIKQYDDCLIIPLHDVDNRWNGLQRITTTGRKKFLTGTRKKGSLFGIQGDKTRVIIFEGFATGASIFMATGDSVAVAFDAGNLKPVAEAIQSKGQFKEVVIAGDNDSWKEAEGQKDTGTAKAREAARAIGCKLVLPRFQNPDGKTTTDFNDLMILEGVGEVKKQIDAAKLDQATILEKAIADMIEMDVLDREDARNRLSKEFGIRKGVIDQSLVKMISEKNEVGSKKIIEEVEPAADPVDGAVLLDEIFDKLASHLVLPDGAGVPITLWAMLTYCHDAFRILPILGIVSPEKRCGKTTLLEFLQGVVSKGLTASNISPAAVFRTVEKYEPTLLIDEALRRSMSVAKPPIGPQILRIGSRGVFQDRRDTAEEPLADRRVFLGRSAGL